MFSKYMFKFISLIGSYKEINNNEFINSKLVQNHKIIKTTATHLCDSISPKSHGIQVKESSLAHTNCKNPIFNYYN